jgi:apolipoprotein N-acyltransferase
MDPKPSTQSLFLRALASAALLSLSWPPLPFAFLLFLAWVPFLQAIDSILATREGLRVYRATWLFAFITFLVWNGLSTWWVAKATVGGGVFAVVVNSFLMTLPILVYVAARRYLGNMASYMTLVSAWLTFEYLHMRWELTWPWLTLGNGFANHPAWVQWYAYTGALGGSLWVLVVNIAIYRELRRLASYALGLSTRYDSSPRQRSTLALILAAVRPALLLAVPLAWSLLLYNRRDPNAGKPVRVAVLQSNYDPHTEKFALGPDQILGEMLTHSAQALHDSLHYLVWPETALTNNIDLATLERHPSLNKMRALLEPYPQLQLIAGINGYRRYNDEASAPEDARAYDFPSGNRVWISAYNSAIQISPGANTQVYNKGILVPGPECYPYYEQLRWLNNVVPGLEDYMGNLSRSAYRESFWTRSPDGDSLAVAPAICYESIFGEYVTGWTNGGAGLLFVITNDGWWGNTAGRKQHLAYARLRAIENRRWVARSANTGISCFINQRGDIVADAGYGRQAVLEHTMYANTEVTPYMKQGDLVGRTAGWVVAGLALLTMVSRLTGGLGRRP